MDGIIFDVDGTLWDSTDSVAESWNLAIRENSTLDLTICLLYTSPSPRDCS